MLDGLTYRFAAGRLTVVTGRSGSGKSTVLRLLAGLEPVNEGRVVVLGQALGGRSRAEVAAFRREHVAVVAQEPDLIGFLGAAEKHRPVAVVARGGTRRGDVRRGRPGWLSRVGLEHRADQRVERLSAGERQRVAIARALAAETELVVVDEPTSRLDQVNAALVGRLLADACRLHGATIICSTHRAVGGGVGGCRTGAGAAGDRHIVGRVEVGRFRDAPLSGDVNGG